MNFGFRLILSTYLDVYYGPDANSTVKFQVRHKTIVGRSSFFFFFFFFKSCLAELSVKRTFYNVGTSLDTRGKQAIQTELPVFCKYRVRFLPKRNV